MVSEKWQPCCDDWVWPWFQTTSIMRRSLQRTRTLSAFGFHDTPRFIKQICQLNFIHDCCPMVFVGHCLLRSIRTRWGSSLAHMAVTLKITILERTIQNYYTCGVSTFTFTSVSEWLCGVIIGDFFCGAKIWPAHKKNVFCYCHVFADFGFLGPCCLVLAPELLLSSCCWLLDVVADGVAVFVVVRYQFYWLTIIKLLFAIIKPALTTIKPSWSPLDDHDTS